MAVVRAGSLDSFFQETPPELVVEIASARTRFYDRTMFDFGYPNWGENPPFHAPVFVATHRGGERITKDGGTSYTFVTDGIQAAIEQARAVADGKDVLLAGGVSIARQALAAGLVDEVVLHVVPKLIGRGVRLFDASEVDLHCTETIPGEGAVHLRYEVR